MLFLLKRAWWQSLLALAVLAGLGLSLRTLLNGGTPLEFTFQAVLFGVAAVGVVLVSDASLHGLFCLAFGDPYKKRHQELVETFRGQSLAAILAGSLMAGVGEELVFRGLGTSLAYLIPSAVVFGLLHHIRRSLWPFTVWAVWQGLLFAAALVYFQNLAVTMVAHFLHDFLGFLLFRYLNGRQR